MELIPTLSFIILVATISTFILSIGAYILYKIREKKGKLTFTPKKHTVEAKLYSPAQQEVKKEVPIQQERSVDQKNSYQRIPFEAQSKPGEYTAKQEKFQQIEFLNGAKGKQQRQQREYKVQSEQEGQLSFGNEEDSLGKKFIKYTPGGYVPVSKIKPGENLKWR